MGKDSDAGRDWGQEEKGTTEPGTMTRRAGKNMWNLSVQPNSTQAKKGQPETIVRTKPGDLISKGIWGTGQLESKQPGAFPVLKLLLLLYLDRKTDL